MQVHCCLSEIVGYMIGRGLVAGMLYASLDRDVGDSCRSLIACDGLGCSLAANAQ